MSSPSYPTPPPPSAAPAPAPVSAEPAQPHLSQMMRVLYVFVAPRKTFADLRNAGWWAWVTPFLLLTIISIAYSYTVETKVGNDAIVNGRFAHASFLQRVTAQMTPEQKQDMLNKQIASQSRSKYTAPLGVLISGLIFALLLWPTFNFGFNAGVTYKTALAVVFYGWIPKLVYFAIAIVTMFIGVEPDGFDLENPVASHLGVLLGYNTDQRYLYHLLAGIDLFSVWWVVVTGIGFAAVAQKKLGTGAAIAVVAVWYALFIGLRALISPIAS